MGAMAATVPAFPETPVSRKSSPMPMKYFL